MVTIRKANEEDIPLLSKVAASSFLQSHAASAAREHLLYYVHEKFSHEQLQKELKDPGGLFRLGFYGDQCAGYAKFILNSVCAFTALKPLCKLDRLYVLEDYLGMKAGKALFEDGVRIAKEKQQKGMWLYVWTGNSRALRFYEKEGFRKIGEAGFPISPTHSNPNFVMLLEF